MVLALPGVMVGGLGGDLLTALLTAGAFAAFLATSSGLTVAVAGVLTQDVASRRFEGVTAFRLSAVAAVAAVLGLYALGLPAFVLIKVFSPGYFAREDTRTPMLITGGLNDPRVTYWEPAKWAARLRATKTDDNVLLLKINMGAGHGGKSGRFESLRETAEEFAFILWQFGM